MNSLTKHKFHTRLMDSVREGLITSLRHATPEVRFLLNNGLQTFTCMYYMSSDIQFAYYRMKMQKNYYLLLNLDQHRTN